MNKKVIKISKLVASIISSRDVTNYLEDEIKKTNSIDVDLDFSDVEFISRSASHSLLSMKEDLSRKLLRKKSIHFINANKEIQEMFRIIAANRAMPKSKPKFEAEKVDIMNIA